MSAIILPARSRQAIARHERRLLTPWRQPVFERLQVKPGVVACFVAGRFQRDLITGVAGNPVYNYTTSETAYEWLVSSGSIQFSWTTRNATDFTLVVKAQVVSGLDANLQANGGTALLFKIYPFSIQFGGYVITMTELRAASTGTACVLVFSSNGSEKTAYVYTDKGELIGVGTRAIVVGLNGNTTWGCGGTNPLLARQGHLEFAAQLDHPVSATEAGAIGADPYGSLFMPAASHPLYFDMGSAASILSGYWGINAAVA